MQVSSPWLEPFWLDIFDPQEIKFILLHRLPLEAFNQYGVLTQKSRDYWHFVCHDCNNLCSTQFLINGWFYVALTTTLTTSPRSDQDLIQQLSSQKWQTLFWWWSKLMVLQYRWVKRNCPIWFVKIPWSRWTLHFRRWNRMWVIKHKKSLEINNLVKVQRIFGAKASRETKDIQNRSSVFNTNTPSCRKRDPVQY